MKILETDEEMREGSGIDDQRLKDISITVRFNGGKLLEEEDMELPEQAAEVYRGTLDEHPAHRDRSNARIRRKSGSSFSATGL